MIYKKLNCKEDNEVFNYLTDTLKETIRGWDYFVDWAKIMLNIENIELPLNILNYLIGKDDIEKEFKYILSKHPEIVNIIPILIACRKQEIKVLDTIEKNNFSFKNYNFVFKDKLSSKEIDDIVYFASNTGLLKIFKDKRIKNVVDYVIGIEVGLDSNARKNRSGSSMEAIIELFIQQICKKYGFTYLTQATASKINQSLGHTVIVDKSNRAFDFAIDNNDKLFLIETNYYSGGGSKLKSTAGEYKELHNFIKSGNEEHEFIWITDGKGWLTAKNPLEETFNYIDYVLNLDMLEKGLLEDILCDNS